MAKFQPGDFGGASEANDGSILLAFDGRTHLFDDASAIHPDATFEAIALALFSPLLAHREEG